MAKHIKKLKNKELTSKKKVSPEHIKKDIKTFQKDCKTLLSHKNLSHNEQFLQKIAHDVQELINDSIIIEKSESLRPISHLIRHMLNTPWDAPFLSTITFFDATLAFKHQEPLQSDLSELMDDLPNYTAQLNDELGTILYSLYDTTSSK